MSECDKHIWEIGWDANDNPCQFVPADFARNLERERDEAREELEKIKLVAQAVVDRWEQPSWKDTEPTAAVIYKLRNALTE